MNEEKKFKEKYSKMLLNFRNHDSHHCPPAESLRRYHNNELSKKERRAIEDHIDMCSACLAALEILQKTETVESKESALPENWAQIEKAIDKRFYTNLKSQPSIVKPKPEGSIQERTREYIWENLSSFMKPVFTSRKLAYVGSMAVITMIYLYGYAFLNRDKTFHLAHIQPEKQLILRDAVSTSNDFNEGLKCLAEGNYPMAIIKFTSYSENHPQHYHAAYYLGLSYLYDAKISLLGLPYKFDQNQVDKSIAYLKKALSLSEENQFYQEDCYWYLGKAYLMLNEVLIAKSQFEKIMKLHQHNLMRKKEAGQIIRQLEHIRKSP